MKAKGLYYGVMSTWDGVESWHMHDCEVMLGLHA